jgi:hypothetical protein
MKVVELEGEDCELEEEAEEEDLGPVGEGFLAAGGGVGGVVVGVERSWWVVGC